MGTMAYLGQLESVRVHQCVCALHYPGNLSLQIAAALLRCNGWM